VKIPPQLLIWLALTLSLAACGGGSGSSAPPPAPDFTVSVSPASLTATEGGSSAPAMVSVTPANGFTGNVSVAISGLPTGATTNPPFPLSVTANSSQQFTIATSDSTPTGAVMLTLHATSGAIAHNATLSLNTGPVIQTSQVGSVLYLQSHANGHTARIGLDTAWGGAIVEISLDGTNFVNAHDTGREVQPAVYDAAPVAGEVGANGWDPVLGGDKYDHGSPTLSQQVAVSSLYTETAPLHWNPDVFGGGTNAPVTSDMTFEQTVTLAPGAPLAFQLHLKLTHNGSDYHYVSQQEFPAVYVNSGYTNLVYYGSAAPWTYGGVNTMSVSTTGSSVYAPEQWAALVDTNNQGLTVFVPGSYPGWASQYFPSSGSGATGNTTVYMRPLTAFNFAPGAVVEGDVYMIPGDAGEARSVVYALHGSVPAANIAAALANVDTPGPNAVVSGNNVAVAGWAFGKTPISAVDVSVDGTVKGTATLGVARPDVAAAFPQIAPADCGWNFSLDTTTMTNGMHTITFHVVDSSNNDILLPPVSVTVNN
jgi:Bacterial Ig domain